ncbi:DUF5682 family protein [Hymenobacter radiodurans]|uniref:DUF5682 family protein n=1 Tax=Hymenobacter radiodurans TaxID=2496028 RepID=UPI0010590105|nr:DUF5682 family protein [Hymenobacter radiodurans]
MPTPDLRLFGIRHHGPGSAASLVAALEAFRPDIVLLECPADAEAALARATHPELLPPVALLVYNPKQQGQASFLPFATFSPEWQAVQWCARNDAHVRCMDLPMALRFGMREMGEVEPVAREDEPDPGPEGVDTQSPAESELADSPPAPPLWTPTPWPTLPAWPATLIRSSGGKPTLSTHPATPTRLLWCWT